MARTFTHVVAFRVSAKEYRTLHALRTTFPETGWGETFRWLLEQPAVRETINERIVEDEPPLKLKGGFDFSLPAGDR